MIVIKIFQGPGNQLFQYAYAFAAAKRLNVELKLDLSWYRAYSKHRQYILDRFQITAQEATEKEIYDIKSCNGANFFEYRWNLLNRKHLQPYYRKPVVIERLEKFDPNYKKVIDNTYIEGYFASRDFFEDQLPAVMQQLQFKSLPNAVNQKTIEGIKSENAVAISFRLGDFLGQPWQNVCTLQYYRRCISYLAERYENLNFYVFSDDIDWVKEYFQIPHPTFYMDYNQPDYMEDFRLLTNFKFHIIANSTFSWWGAMLSQVNDKVVLCPQYWLNPDPSSYGMDFEGKAVDFSHVLPNEWIKIPNLMEGDSQIVHPTKGNQAFKYQ